MEVYGILEVQRTKIEQGNQFQHPPSFHSIYASYFQASSHLDLILTPLKVQPQGSTHYPFLLLFHIEDNVYSDSSIWNHVIILISFGVLIIHSCFCFTLRKMFISSLGGEFKNSLRKKKNKFPKSNFCISLPVLVSCLVVSCMCFSLFLLFILCLI